MSHMSMYQNLPDLGYSYAFVANVHCLVEQKSFELLPKHELRQANPAEIGVLKEIILETLAPPKLLRWEYKLPLKGKLEHLNPKEWRYFLIAFEGNNQAISELNTMLSIARLSLAIPFTVISHKDFKLNRAGVIWHPEQLFHILNRDTWQKPHAVYDVTLADVNELAALFEAFKKSTADPIDVRRLAREVQVLEALPTDLPLQFLGYFTVLESLLTHSPAAHDPTDSLTRQIRSKVALLDKRLTHPVDYSAFGQQMPLTTLWTKMYALRSKIAHGDTPDFSTGALHTLISQEVATKLLKDTVKAIARHALVEPQLINDLRDC